MRSRRDLPVRPAPVSLLRFLVPARGHHPSGPHVPAPRPLLLDIEELVAERGIEVDHFSAHRWVQRFATSSRRGSSSRGHHRRSLARGRNLSQGSMSPGGRVRELGSRDLIPAGTNESPRPARTPTQQCHLYRFDRASTEITESIALQRGGGADHKATRPFPRSGRTVPRQQRAD
jgi:hypothetical protein